MYRPDHGELCRVIETQTLWGETVCRVWLPGKDTVVRLPAARLRPVDEASVGTVDGIAYLAAPARTIRQNGLGGASSPSGVTMRRSLDR